jgi:hypothetical protein
VHALRISHDGGTGGIGGGGGSNWMDMRDAETGALLWESGAWGAQRMLREEVGGQWRCPRIAQCGVRRRSLMLPSA